MKYHQCKNDMAQLISSQKDVLHQEWKDDIREWPQVEHVDIYNHLILNLSL